VTSGVCNRLLGNLTWGICAVLWTSSGIKYWATGCSRWTGS